VRLPPLEGKKKEMIMDAERPTDNAQAMLWNGHAGRVWVEAQGELDRLFKPFEDLLAEAVAAGPGNRVLDVGCGTGATTLAAARRLGAAGRCLGIDISEPMVTAARARATREGLAASFLIADAQTHAFAPESIDMIISRFGVMFFDDPVAAFANLWCAASPGAAMNMIAWRSIAENPFMTTAERAAAPLMELPPRAPGGPGQFAFADAGYVDGILKESGWTGIDIQPIDVTCSLAETALEPYFTRLGPLGVALTEADAATRAKIIAAVRPAFDPYVRDGEVRFTAACWMIAARR
jgi:SAM-dependent methyltransferase